MKAVLSIFFLTCWLFSDAQDLTQTIRGKVIDAESEMNLPGASVVISSVNPAMGTSTGADGFFELEKVPIGRHTIIITFLGYEKVVLPNILVGSAKEVILNVSLSESFEALGEVVIEAEAKKEEANNEMAIISARSFSTEETSRFAASVDDPARMAQAYAGVSSTDDLSNEIIVRGNSPLGLLWRINEVEVPSPNHFSQEGASGGGISALSINMLDNSDFYTGAFPAEYGNATSGVFDVKLRNGNNAKREYAFQVGVLGTDISLEGPIRKESNASYLINYRYSTLALLSEWGIINIGGDNNIFQDLAFQFNVPTKKAGVFKLFALGGLSTSESSADDEELENNPSGTFYEERFHSDMGVIGLSNQYFIGQKTYLKTTLSHSVQSIGYDEGLFNNSVSTTQRLYKNSFVNKAYRLNTYMNRKFNVKSTVRAGIILSRLEYDLYAADGDGNNGNRVFIDDEGSTEQVQAYGQWKYRFHKDWTLHSGFHYLYFALNGNQSFEPRLGLNYKIDEVQTLSAGFGLHSRLAPLSFYNSNIRNEDGSFSRENKNLEMSKALHYIIGYDRQLGEELRMKIELYYQDLFNIPVSPDSGSVGSGINYSSGYTNVRAIDEGTAHNVGAELTLEKFFSNLNYYLFTASVFDSKYQMPDGREYNTRFNSNYRFSLLGGKEFEMGKEKNKLLGINAKLIWAGGNRYTPIDELRSRISQETVYFEPLAFEEKVPDYYRADLTASYRINREKVAHIISIQIQNITNRKNVASYYFDTATQQIEASEQFGLIPILKYRIEF